MLANPSTKLRLFGDIGKCWKACVCAVAPLKITPSFEYFVPAL